MRKLSDETLTSISAKTTFKDEDCTSLDAMPMVKERFQGNKAIVATLKRPRNRPEKPTGRRSQR